MKPSDIALLNLPGHPAIAADGRVLVSVAHPDLHNDRYHGTLRLLAGGSVVGGVGTDTFDLTFGPRDSEPVIGPDGHTVVFLRAGEAGPGQLYAIDLRGGEARQLASHPLGAERPVFAPDGDRIAYLAQVPETGRYGTDPDVGADAEPPRPIDRLSYRRDGKGFLVDKPQQVFVLELGDGAEPTQITDEPAITGGPAFLPDGRIAYLRSTEPDLPHSEIATIPADGAHPGRGDTLTGLPGGAAHLVVDGRTAYYLSPEFEGIDMSGRTPGLWAFHLDAAAHHRRLTGEEVHVDPAMAPVPVGDVVLVGVLDRGSEPLIAVPVTADRLPLDEAKVVIGGRVVVTSFAASALGAPDAVTVAAVVSDRGTPGDVVTIEIDRTGTPVGPVQPLTDLAADLRATGVAEHIEITATSADGYPVHGFLLLPEGPGPHPVLLDVHGGPHAAYGWGLFDEAQVYASAGYAVVLPNPRGSAGYGHEHGRTILQRLGSVDADDVLALLDAALSRPDCDGRRVGVMGGSYGGFMTSWLASHAPERFTAAISERAVNAWDSFAGSSDIGYYFAENYVGADRESQWRASPLAYADDIRLPMLIIHSEHDWRCPLEQGQRLFVALRRRGAEAEMLLFPSEGHELSRSGRPKHRVQRFDAILDWWDRYLPVG